MRRAVVVRVLPFAVFMGLLFLRQRAPADGSWGFDTRWLYSAQVLVTGAVLLAWWREYGELARQTLSALREAGAAAAVGLLVFWLWIQLAAPWFTLALDTAPMTTGNWQFW